MEPRGVWGAEVGQKEEDGIHEEDQGECDTKVGGTDGGGMGVDMETGY